MTDDLLIYCNGCCFYTLTCIDKIGRMADDLKPRVAVIVRRIIASCSNALPQMRNCFPSLIMPEIFGWIQLSGWASILGRMWKIADGYASTGFAGQSPEISRIYKFRSAWAQQRFLNF